MARADEQVTLTAKALKSVLDAQSDDDHAAASQWFFKTGPGEYGEGDRFIGLKMPVVRATAKAFRELPLEQLDTMLQSPIHEHRMAALVILSERAKRHSRKGEVAELERLSDFYLDHTDRINNWDLVDVSCRDVVGGYLVAIDDASPLERLAGSSDLWERRIAMISTSAFIARGELAPTFRIAERLLKDEHDLIHKAVGWMLREAGKRDREALEDFLATHAQEMPRTALRYSIERMSPERRAYWLAYRSNKGTGEQ